MLNIYSLRLELSVYCERDYYGSDCRKFCSPGPNDHYSCSASGDKLCHPGKQVVSFRLDRIKLRQEDQLLSKCLLQEWRALPEFVKWFQVLMSSRLQRSILSVGQGRVC
ncbi:delta-like protein [Plakobranchus ocellatus]|uniref:Delta-like protein n=1 Tax=Plakobranchus ocellatus TaxID=259542 RepID=A0AAV3ZII1_9GAST|nr:delta-like protein [Plakobranchus ocellatus]